MGTKYTILYFRRYVRRAKESHEGCPPSDRYYSLFKSTHTHTESVLHISRAIYKTAMWRNATISPYAGGRIQKSYNGTTAYTWIKPNTDGTAQTMNDMVLFLDQ